MLQNKIGFGWDSKKYHTHSFITKNSINAVKENSAQAEEFFTPEISARIGEFSEKPDFDETKKFNSRHFYSTKTGKNFLKKDDTALKAFIEHGSRAVELYKQGKTAESGQELGRASHFLQDLTQDDHTNTETLIEAESRVKKHLEFEHYTGKNQQNFRLTTPTPATPLEKTQDFTSVLTDLAKETLQKSQNSNPNKINWYMRGQIGLRIAQEQTAKFFSAYLNEINKPT